jgi:hypothetical protein
MGMRRRALVERLLRDVGQPGLHLWCAQYEHTGIPPCLESHKLTTPLRSAPAIIREVTSAIDDFNIPEYSDSGLPSPGDGHDVIRLRHAGAGHSGRWPLQCSECGRGVARVLTTQLGMGTPGW